MENQQEFTYKNEEDNSFVCQCIINTGSNNDPVEKNGMSHIIEHFLIFFSRRNRYFKNVMIHGFTGFYYTNYYWYVNDEKEALESYSEFEKIFCESVICTTDEELLEIIKKDIEKEINFFEEKTDKVAKVVSTLSDGENEILLPIGKISDVRKIKYKDMMDYINQYYTPSNVHKFLFNKDNQISCVTKENVKKLQLYGVTEIAYVETVQLSCSSLKDMCVNFRGFNRSMKSNSIKFVYKDIFVNSLAEIVVGEIFMMQVCDYVKKIMNDNLEIVYEKIFISIDKKYFVLSMQNMNSREYENLENILRKQKLKVYSILQDILEENGFKKKTSFMLNYLLEYDKSKVGMNEIMTDLINYTTLLYDSYNIIDNKEGLIVFVKGLEYDQYCEYVHRMTMRMEKEDIRILY